MTGTIEKPLVRTSNLSPLLAWSDEKLLLSYREKRDQRMFEELVRRYEKELYSYLRHYLGSPEMAEDVFQQTFLQVHLKCGQFEPGRKVRPWLYTVATNQAIDYRRRNRRHRMSSLDRVGRGGEEGMGPLAELLVASANDPANDVARVVPRGRNVDLFARVEISGGGAGSFGARRHGEKPAACGYGEAHRIAFQRGPAALTAGILWL